MGHHDLRLLADGNEMIATSPTLEGKQPEWSDVDHSPMTILALG